jgi:P-type conjugative transfer protein TrbJ
MKIKHMAVNVALIIATALFSMSVNAGVPVIDGTNLSQNILSAIEDVAQTIKQVEQYGTQLQQYENEIKNTIAPAAYIWDQAQSTMNLLRNATDTLNYYKNQAGNIGGYLSKFQDVSYYRSSPCYSGGGCSPAEQAAIEQSQVLGSQAQKRANDAMFQGLDQQQQYLQNDAAQLQLLQSQAGGADGQMKAIQAGNQLASHQANQLLEIRGLMITQQNAIATRDQVLVDREAHQQVASEMHYRVPVASNRDMDRGF